MASTPCSFTAVTKRATSSRAAGTDGIARSAASAATSRSVMSPWGTSLPWASPSSRRVEHVKVVGRALLTSLGLVAAQELIEWHGAVEVRSPVVDLDEQSHVGQPVAHPGHAVTQRRMEHEHLCVAVVHEVHELVVEYR